MYWPGMASNSWAKSGPACDRPARGRLFWFSESAANEEPPNLYNAPRATLFPRHEALSGGPNRPIYRPMSETTAAPLKGAALIRDEVTRLPDRPGVYRMMGDEGEVLYVGKARSLKKRVIQYAQGRFHTQRIANMVDLTRSMEFITTRTETDALLLEENGPLRGELDQHPCRVPRVASDIELMPGMLDSTQLARLDKARGSDFDLRRSAGPFTASAEVVSATRSKQVPWSNSSLLGEVYLAEK